MEASIERRIEATIKVSFRVVVEVRGALGLSILRCCAKRPLEREMGAVGFHERGLDDVSELPYVTRPTLRLKGRQTRLVYRHLGSSELLQDVVDKDGQFVHAPT